MCDEVAFVKKSSNAAPILLSVSGGVASSNNSLEMKSMSNASAEDQERVVEKFRNLIADDKARYDGMPMSDAILRFEIFSMSSMMSR